MKIFAIFTALIITWLAFYFYSNQFKPSNISLALPPNQVHAPILMTQEVKTLFEQPFSYLGEGNQAYALTSKDGKFVIKFFKNTPITSQSWMDLFSSFPFIETYLNTKRLRAQRKYERVFNAYEIAYAHDQQHCGLMYIHLYQSNDLKSSAKAIDAFGISHSIDLDNYAFIIQKKGEPLKSLLKRELSEGKIELVKTRLQQVIEMYIAEYQKGVFDHDHNLMTNIGFADGIPMRIDVGKLVLDPTYTSKDIYLKDLDKIIHQRIIKWFKRHSPDHTNDVLQTLEIFLLTN